MHLHTAPLKHLKLPFLMIGSVLIAACGDKAADAQAVDSERYRAEIIRTDYGVPHITAGSWGSLGFGEAYAAAEDHVCNMALALLQSRGESAAVFGPGDKQANVARDVVVKALDIPARAKGALAAQNTDIRSWIEGYAAGYNHYLETHTDSVGSWCDGASWVQPVTPEAFMAQYLTLVQTLPRVGGALLAAGLPSPQDAVASIVPTPDAFEQALLDQTLTHLRLEGMGSNAWALGTTRTENGRGLLLANPHYPWYGIARFWEKHLTIPGTYDAYGVGLVGTPGVAIGFNEQVGWSHTVSNSKRTVIYQLTLDPQNPQRYRWKDNWRDLESVEVEVDVLGESGLERMTHTMWFSHHGPLIHLPGLSEDPYTVFAVRDANADNQQTLAQWQAMATAKSMDEFIDAHRRFNAMPWVNTIATSADGHAVYIDNSTVGALRDEAITQWQQQVSTNPKLQQLYLAQGLVILDGSQPINDWRQTDAPVPNTEPFDRRPLIESDAYVFNANDSYWLSDPANPSAVYSPLYGPTDSPRSVRTRMNMELLRPDSPYGYAGEDGKFSIQEVQAALFGNDSLTARLLLPELLAACEKAPKRTLDGDIVDLEQACQVLTSWDQSFNIDSQGAVLFREWLTRYPYTDTYLGRGLFATPFDPKQPRTTPNGLADIDTALDRLAEATRLLTEAGIPLDSPLGHHQTAHRADQKFAVHGGNRREGIANLQISTRRGQHYDETPVFTGSNRYIGDSESLSETGYNVIHGSSFIMTLGFTENGPKAQAILSYSESGDPASNHFADQTQLYRDKQWRDILFTREQIEAHVQSE
ncbi:MAG: penicillin acylase family protein, partial [Halieaceae bacterium]|nr:penicillin acylase family protein [Halieaceae bacterium]